MHVVNHSHFFSFAKFISHLGFEGNIDEKKSLTSFYLHNNLVGLVGLKESGWPMVIYRQPWLNEDFSVDFSRSSITSYTTLALNSMNCQSKKTREIQIL